MGNDNVHGKEHFNPALIHMGEGKKDLPSVNMVNPHEEVRVEFEKDTGIYTKHCSTCHKPFRLIVEGSK